MEDLKVSLQYTQKDGGQLKESCNKLSLIGNTFEGDIHKLAEPLLSMDYKSAGRAQGGGSGCLGK